MKFLTVFILFTFELCAQIYPYETPITKYLKTIELTEPESGLEMIDCIYLINLDIRPQKWDRMKPLLDERGLHANRVSGIYGWKIPIEVQNELAGPHPRRVLPGHLGCFLTHLSIIKDAVERDFETIWVCEDDLEFTEDVGQLPGLLKDLYEIDPDWDVFYTDIDTKDSRGTHFPRLAADFRPDHPQKPLDYYTQKVQVTKDIMKIGHRAGMYSYLISRKGLRKILNYFTHVYIWTNIDMDIHYIPEIREYATTRDVVTIWFKSSISDTQREPRIN